MVIHLEIHHSHLDYACETDLMKGCEIFASHIFECKIILKSIYRKANVNMICDMLALIT